MPGPLGAAIASKIATAGAQASQVSLPGRLPLPPAVLHQAINQAFVDALHGSYLIAGVGLLVAALLVAFLFQRAPRTSVAPADAQVTTAASAVQHIVAAVDAGER
ncbi:MAG TPA: hypothetical protein VK140_04645 [Ktedonobacteraceae bacterium]|nr:hypothetical protein [Ktedonobacteraceae bacterium]